MAEPKGIKDFRLRLRLPVGGVNERSIKAVQENSLEEARLKIMTAVRAFWSPYAYQGDPELQEVSLQAIQELADQIVEIALLADLPVEQLNLRTEVLKLRQERLRQETDRPPTTERQAAKPEVDKTSETNGTSTTTTKQTRAKPKAVGSLFDD